MRLACSPESLELIELTTVPLGNHTTIKSHNSKTMELYNNLVQYSVKNRAIIYDLDELREVGAIESLDKLIDPDLVVITGFNLTAAKSDTVDNEQVVHRKVLVTNETCNLLFELQLDSYQDGSVKPTIKGQIFRTYAEIDLVQLQAINKVHKRSKARDIKDIDLESIVA